MEKYLERFLENGVEDIETVLELNDEHFEAMKVPMGHKLKIMKHIKEMRATKGMAVSESR